MESSLPCAILAALCALLVTSSTAHPVTSGAQLVTKFPFKSAAFNSLFQVAPAQDAAPGGGAAKGKVRYDLILTSFSFLDSNVAVVEDIGRQLKNGSAITPRSINKEMKWPNFATGVPAEVLDSKTPYVAIPDGFLVPGKGAGSVTLQPLAGGQSHVISGSSGWFYHRVQWVDMDKDGTLDALTCKAQKPLFGSSKGEMVWYGNPQDHSLASPWKEHPLVSGPDVLFRMANVTVGGQTTPTEVIVTAEYFQPRLRIFWTTSPKQDWSDAKLIKSRDIDSVTKAEGSPFDVLVDDVNRDGNLDLIVTFNDAKNGTVVIYEFPKDFRTGVFKRRVITSGYHATSGGPHAGAPGIVTLVPPKNKSQKPSIAVAGDDSGIVSILTPANLTSPTDWTYKRTDILHTEKSRTGSVSVADVDGDSRPEIFVNSYNEGLVYVYRV